MYSVSGGDGVDAKRIRNAADAVRAAIYPDRCPLCDVVIRHNSGMCKSCKNSAAVITGARCFFCGCSLDSCDCGHHSHFYEAVTGPFLYKDTVRKGIAVWKFRGGLRNTRFFAKLIAACVRRDFSNQTFDFISFVPQTKEESSDRAYNQSELLAREVGLLLDLPVENVLVKIFETPHQHTTAKYMRSGNVFGAFGCKNKKMVKGKNILLIDDIKTSGSTLNECAKVLQLADAAKVFCAVIAIA